MKPEVDLPVPSTARRLTSSRSDPSRLKLFRHSHSRRRREKLLVDGLLRSKSHQPYRLRCRLHPVAEEGPSRHLHRRLRHRRPFTRRHRSCHLITRRASDANPNFCQLLLCSKAPAALLGHNLPSPVLGKKTNKQKKRQKTKQTSETFMVVQIQQTKLNFLTSF